MTEAGIGFIIWALAGAVFIGLGIYCIFSKKSAAFGFWANAKMFEVEDVRGYNRALGKLWCAYGIGFILLGIPLVNYEQNSPVILLSVIGVMAETIAVMVVYITKIEKSTGKSKNREILIILQKYWKYVVWLVIINLINRRIKISTSYKRRIRHGYVIY